MLSSLHPQKSFFDSKCVFFADDFTILSNNISSIALSHALSNSNNSVTSWFADDKLHANVDKTQTLNFHLKNCDNNLTSPIKSIGVYLNHKHTWESHINQFHWNQTSYHYTRRQNDGFKPKMKICPLKNVFYNVDQCLKSNLFVLCNICRH